MSSSRISWPGLQLDDGGVDVAGRPEHDGVEDQAERAELILHAVPVPAKRAKGAEKSFLDVHPVEGAAVRRMFAWRLSERLDYQVIADRLNEDLVSNPPPTPVEPERAVGVGPTPACARC